MNTLQELIEYGFPEKTARLMLDSYGKHIGEVHGCNKVTDVTYIVDGKRKIELTCSLCGAVYFKTFSHGRNKWSELRSTCSCQTQPRDTLPRVGVVKNDDPSYIGKIYGDYEVVDVFRLPHLKNGGNTVMWMCKCIHCGQIFKAQPSVTKKGARCKCQIEAEIEERRSSEIGKKYNRLTVLEIERRKSSTGRSTSTYARCKCDCGGEITAQLSSIKRGTTKSCGCIQEELIRKAVGDRKVARSKSPLYPTWSSMKQRCFNKNNISYKNYGGRGITVCPDWLGPEGFDRFEKWAYENGYAPETGVSLDRIDANGNYEPSNCRWANLFVQAVNKRPSGPAKRRPAKTYVIGGEEKTLNQWCKEYSISTVAVQYRMKTLGMSLEDALKTPKTRKGNIYAGEQAKQRVKDLNKCNSYIEANLYLAAARHSISLIPQYKIGDYHVDFLVDNTNIVVECDGYDHHKTTEQIRSDYQRERFLQKQGYLVVRFSGTEINDNPDECCREISEIIGANEQVRKTNAG